jgi:pimeloyl-ACP methyl ester carboxylesterase
MVLRDKNINTIPEPEYVNVAELTAVESGTLPLLPLGTKHWKGIASLAVKGGKGSDNLQLPDQAGSRTPWSKQSDHSSLSLHRSSSATPGPLDFGLSEGFDSFPDGIAPPPLGSSKRKGFTAYSYSYSYSYSRSPASATKIKPPNSSTSSRPPSPAPPTGPSFGVALQQASHAECEPGTTSELLSIVLGRQHANRPWQYAVNYADFSLPVKIYWGQDDDKISEKSVRWMEKTMTAGVELLVLQGEGHNLMASSGTMLSVFQSLAEEVAVAAKLPQPDLRYY